MIQLRQFIWSFIITLTFAAGATADNIPREIAGIALGSDVTAYPNIIESNFLKDVVVTDWHGFRKGTISYGMCRYKNTILKINMKYEDKSEGFFKELLKRFRSKYGEPAAWHGDSFGVMHIWKWHFVDADSNKISLTLQYNGKNSNETIGNIVKLSYPGKIEEERLCFIRMCDDKMQTTDRQTLEELKKKDWSYLIPK